MHSFIQFHLALVATLFSITLFVSAAPISEEFTKHLSEILSNDFSHNVLTAQSPCFPSLGFQTPETLPSSTDNWWCPPETEYAFLGFSYQITACQSKKQMVEEFTDIRERFQGRFIRLYGNCDNEGFHDDLIDAAYEASLGVHALIWFGWDDPNIWKTRRDSILKTYTTNPKAPFVIRALQFGSEPLYDHALAPGELAKQVSKAKEALNPLGIQVTVSDMVYGYERRGGAQEVLDAIDVVDIHTLPFFSHKASTGDKAWPLVKTDIEWFQEHANGKKIYLSQNGWPSTTYPGVMPNSPAAVADVPNEAAYYNMLNDHCGFFKTAPGGGIGWFAHMYSDAQAPGYGILAVDGSMKFDFHPAVAC